MKNKRSIYTIAIIFTCAILSSCSDWLDVNHNPNSAEKVDPGYLFNYAVVNWAGSTVTKKQHNWVLFRYGEISEKDELNNLDKKWDDLKSKKEAIFIGYASNNKVIRQLIDLALLQNNMLRGEALNNFVKRSIELI